MIKKIRSINRRQVVKGAAAAGLAAAAMPGVFRPAIAVPEIVKIGLVGPKTGPLALFYEEMSWAIEHAKKATDNSITINAPSIRSRSWPRTASLIRTALRR